MQLDKYSDLIQKLENDELELPNPGVELYVQLLASYLYQNELAEAKHLWKRIPQQLKTDNKELERLQVLMRALLANSLSEFFKNANFAWSEGLKNIMDDLLEKTRRDVFTLVGHAYTSIFEHNLMQLTQMPRNELKEACIALEWTYEGDGQLVVVLPKRPPNVSHPCASSENQLLKLTEFVSFLEN